VGTAMQHHSLGEMEPGVRRCECHPRARGANPKTAKSCAVRDGCCVVGLPAAGAMLSVMQDEAVLAATAALHAAGARFAYLHGSRATGTARPDSDTDVAAWFGRDPAPPSMSHDRGAGSHPNQAATSVSESGRAVPAARLPCR